MDFETQRVIPAEHPSLAGHFPGNPIVPGVLILQEVWLALTAWNGDACLRAIPVVKFMAPLRPGQVFSIRFTKVAERRVQFQCVLHDQVLVQGQLEINQ